MASKITTNLCESILPFFAAFMCKSICGFAFVWWQTSLPYIYKITWNKPKTNRKSKACGQFCSLFPFAICFQKQLFPYHFGQAMGNPSKPNWRRKCKSPSLLGPASRATKNPQFLPSWLPWLASYCLPMTRWCCWPPRDHSDIVNWMRSLEYRKRWSECMLLGWLISGWRECREWKPANGAVSIGRRICIFRPIQSWQRMNAPIVGPNNFIL